MKHKKYTIWMEEVGMKDVPLVGGKNASLGEMIKHLKPKGVEIPGGFIVTAEAYRYFLKEEGLDKFIRKTLRGLNTHNTRDLAKRGKAIREAIKKSEFPADLEKQIVEHYKKMEKKYGRNIDVAVRSSATAEDLPGASFAGEHETYLGIRGSQNVLTATKSAMASLFTNRAISYRQDKGFGHFKVALSVAVQLMVRSDKGSSGVMFTLDTESGFPNAILINAAYGLGEMIVQGKVTPDEYFVFKKTLGRARDPIISKHIGTKASKMIYGASKGIKPVKIINTTKKERDNFVLTDREVLKLAKWGLLIEEHYTKRSKRKWMPMDMEWAKDGRTGKLYIVQARPETIHAERDYSKIKSYSRKQDGKVLTKGASVGSQIAVGKARVILDVKHIHDFKKGEVLVTDITDPDWEPIMKIAAAIVTDKGGRTSHAAIVSRELGIPAVVGSENATRKIKTAQTVTVDTTGSDGVVFAGALKFKVTERSIKKIPKPKTKIMMNLATPETAFEKSFLPNEGVGLAREEFIATTLGVHPLAVLDYKNLERKVKDKIDKRSRGWKDKKKFYIDNLAYGIAKIGAAFYPKPVIFRLSDFKTNEYRGLIGGEKYEPEEENPMIGWRGASRYYDPDYKEAFKLECLAYKKVRAEMGLSNVALMVPFCRTPEEGQKVVDLMRQYGLDRKKDKSLKIYVMCEIPSNVVLGDEFLDIFDGMSIGTNDLTQLTLGLDRDSGIVSHVSNENNEAVKELVALAIDTCKRRKKYIGICGQAPSDYPEFAEFLVAEGIDSMSLNPDTVLETTIAVAKKEKAVRRSNRKRMKSN